MRRAVVIGAAGFIGRRLVSELASAGWDPTAIDLPGTLDHPDLRGITTRPADLSTETPDVGGADAVWVLSQSPAYRTFPEGASDLFAVNTLAPIRIAEACAAAGVPRLVSASTGSVYAPSFEPLKESDPTRSDQPYALSKLTAEHALSRYSERTGLCVSLPRPFGVFGPGQQAMLVANLAGRIARGEPISLAARPGEDPQIETVGGIRLSMTPVKFAALALARLGEPDAPEGPINIAGPASASVRELADWIGEAIGRTPRFELAGSTRDTDLIADCSILDGLGLPAPAALRDEIADAVRLEIRLPA